MPAEASHSARIHAAFLIAAALLLGSPAKATTEEGPEPIWVFFRDRGPVPSEAARAHVEQILSPRALARRAKAQRERARLSGAPLPAVSPPLDEKDFEPAESYVARVLATGAKLRTRSRWLNAVSVEADPVARGRIRALPFVRDVRPVARMQQAETSGADQVEYGPGLHQIEMLGIPEAHAMGFHGEGVLVAVLDSGFDLTHETFSQLEVRAQRDFVFHDED